MSVVTVEELKAKLGLPAEPPDAALDARLQSMIDETQALVEGYLGVPIEPTEMTLDRCEAINGSASIVLPVYPVISVEAITIADEPQDLDQFWLYLCRRDDLPGRRLRLPAQWLLLLRAGPAARGVHRRLRARARRPASRPAEPVREVLPDECRRQRPVPSAARTGSSR